MTHEYNHGLHYFSIRPLPAPPPLGLPMSNRPPAVTVVGSINLDLIATAERLPTAGETIGGAMLSEQPGGKGANQAAAAARLGGNARMVGAVGNDGQGQRMLDALAAAGVDTADV